MYEQPISGALIIWKNRATVDFNNVKDSDYILVKTGQCSRGDGEPVTFEGEVEDYEWLANYFEPMTEYDPRLFILNEIIKPTNIPHPNWPNYHQYKFSYQLVKRSTEDIIASVRAEETIANQSLANEGEFMKLNQFATSFAIKTAKGLPVSEAEENADARFTEVTEKMTKNAANADLIIEKINNNENIDISSGWEYDNLTSPAGFPFSN